MFENNGILLVICLTLLIGLGVPAMVYAGLRRGGVSQFTLIRRAAKRAQKPWQFEDNNLEELGREVEKLRKTQP
jgi:hypothetical protein